MTIKPLSLLVLPNVLKREVEKRQLEFVERNPDYSEWFAAHMSDTTFAEQLYRTWAGSCYVAELCCYQPLLFKQMVDSGEILLAYSRDDISQRLKQLLHPITEEDALNKALRQFRGKMMIRIIWRDLNRLATMQQTTADVSALAAACIEQTMDFHHQKLCALYGVPTATIEGQAVAQTLLVIGMGKLGASELNLSSDIDLIFCYPYGGDTVGAKRSLDNSEFFTRLARKLIQSLDQVTVDGFVFRVDMRLRPYGDSGSLVASFGAMEEYYQDQGRDWERYAMIKARIVAGDLEQGKILAELLRPFVYRRYIDFSAIDSLRSMKKMIRQEVKRRRLDNDVKLGAGGIREVEFIAQSFQLIRGGRERDLQEQSVLKILSVLAHKGYLPENTANDLIRAYNFLRNAEHAIQALHDQQTQALPDTEYAQAALAYVMGFDRWDDWAAELQLHRENVDKQFKQVICDSDEDEEDTSVDTQWINLWLGGLDEDVNQQTLHEAGHEYINEVLGRLNRLREDVTVLRMQTVGRERLDQFMPLLLAAVSQAEQPSATLLRIIPLVESVLRRTAYLVLLVENPGALQQLVILCAGSPWIADQLTQHPVLLDELLDAQSLYQVPEKNALRAELQQQMLRISWDDLESQMEALRYFKLAHQLRVSAAEVSGKLILMKVSDYLTMIAEVVLEHVLELAWVNLTGKHGRPQKTDGQPCDKDFIVVGYGKMGGIELGHSSDLDLVFIHGAASNLATDGERSIDSGLFFVRLGQRMIHILTAQTPSGMLYEVDMRLRPSGSSGLLVTSLEAFEIYQHQQAWTWEHQALVRARPVAGDQTLAKDFIKFRQKLLCEPRDEDKLKQDVVEMREKMRDHLLPKGLERAETPIFHLKHGRGGIVDIEFMVQYAVLAWSHQHAGLAEFTDNIRILESLQNSGLFSEIESTDLSNAYKVLRAQAHRLSLQQQPNELPMVEVEAECEVVMNKWRELME